MKQYYSFSELYKLAFSIISKVSPEQPKYKSIEFVRLSTDKTLLNSYIQINSIPLSISRQINSKPKLKFSLDSLIKNMIEHPELTLREYLNIENYIAEADYILKKGSKHLIYFRISRYIYQFVIKSTKTGSEMFITTFHRASIKQLIKDKKRYPQIKIDSSDYEDSKYPSVT